MSRGRANGVPAPTGAPVARDGAAARTSSIARSIALSAWARRLAWFITLDVLLFTALIVAFVWQALASAGVLPAEVPGLLGTMRVDVPAGDLTRLSLSLVDAAGVAHTSSIAAYLPFVYCVGVVVLVAEALSLFSGLFEARRVRRKLRPLNDLALTAEALAATAADPALTTQKIASLEHAISEADVEAPQVTTGDKDLVSIEAALNGLLRRMQEARSQQARFVSDASHELRTPIAVIEGYVGMLDRWGKDDPAVLEESVTALKAESAHMSELVEQLLFLARGDSGRQALEPTRFDVAELVREVAGESQMINAEHRYAAGAPGPASLTADRAMLKQALRILVQNAARYSAADTLIELSVVTRDLPDQVGIAVQDQGAGISEADAPHVFDRFWRSDAAREKSGSGTGLGLAIAKWIVDAHDGQIELLSREGVGTRFTIWLPLR